LYVTQTTYLGVIIAAGNRSNVLLIMLNLNCIDVLMLFIIELKIPILKSYVCPVDDVIIFLTSFILYATEAVLYQ